MFVLWIRKDFHQDERALLALDDAGHGPKRRSGNVIPCSASASIASGQSVSASGPASSVLHAMECSIVSRPTDCDSQYVIHGLRS